MTTLESELSAVQLIEYAKETFRELPQDVYVLLREAAARSRMVRRRLQEGYWASLPGAIRGLAVERRDERFMQLAQVIPALTPLELRVEEPRRSQ